MIKKIHYVFSTIFFYCLFFTLGSTLPNSIIAATKINSFINNNILSKKDAAAFALVVYHDEVNEPKLPDGFSLLCQCPAQFRSQNYYGEAYYRLEYGIKNDGTKAPEPCGITVVIVHRGTQINRSNINDDLLVALKVVPHTFYTGSKPFSEYVYELVEFKFPIEMNYFVHHYIHIGHSLGAIHAELNYLSQRAKYYFDFDEISFESPGSKEMIEFLILNNELPAAALWWASSMEIINTDINLINTFNSQASSVWQIDPGYDVIEIPSINLSPVDFKYFSTFFTLDQHGMEKIYKYFSHGGRLLSYGGFPIGPINAYNYYKKYNPDWHPDHKQYWDKILEIYWNKHKEIHSQYNNDFNSYLNYMIKHHLS